MRLQRLVLAAAMAAFLSPALPSSAAPFAGSVDEATGVVKLRGTDGRMYQLDFELAGATPAGGASESASYVLNLKISKCVDGGCQLVKTYGRRLASNEVSAPESGDSVTVTTRMLGTSLSAVWTRAADPNSVSAPQTKVSVNGVDLEIGGGDATEAAGFRVTLYGATCRDEAATFVRSSALATEGYEPAPGGATPPSATPSYFATRRSVRPKCVA